MSNNYKEEYEKYKNISLSTEIVYKLKKWPAHKLPHKFQILILNESEEKAKIKNLDTGFESEKTMHWCRKNLEKIEL